MKKLIDIFNEGYKESGIQKKLLKDYISNKVSKYNFKSEGGKDRYWIDGKFNIYIDNNGWIEITDKNDKTTDIGIFSATTLPKMATDALDKVL